MRRTLLLATLLSTPAGASAAYTYDPANNRTNVTTTAPSGGGGMAQAQKPPAKDQPSQSSGAAHASPRR